jgi:hypothetical protein
MEDSAHTRNATLLYFSARFFGPNFLSSLKLHIICKRGSAMKISLSMTSTLFRSDALAMRIGLQVGRSGGIIK